LDPCLRNCQSAGKTLGQLLGGEPGKSRTLGEEKGVLWANLKKKKKKKQNRVPVKRSKKAFNSGRGTEAKGHWGKTKGSSQQKAEVGSQSGKGLTQKRIENHKGKFEKRRRDKRKKNT